ncbi:hypothetical protein OYC64_006638 [Pagothenia borchgrevinki]|uniref:Uncharacterized protein n=1 Tax=Pagothenia borchgrevinki TaxID=8213 RepID=A0ABD2GJR3_PAGBO
MNLDPQTQKGRGRVLFLWRSSCPAVLCVRTSGRIQSLPAVDTGSADSASPHTGSSALHQETPAVPSVEKDGALYKQIVVCRRF